MKKTDQKYHLIARHLAGENKQEDQQQWQQVLQDEAEEKKLNVLREYWTRFFPLKTVSSKQRILSNVMVQVLGAESLKRPRMTPWYSAVGVLVVALALSMFWGLYHGNQGMEMIHYQAEVGEIKNIVLPDGTEVSLNATSSLVVPQSFEGDKRQVILMGEGYFNVTKDEAHPFVISTSHMDVKVLGTQFNLKAYPDDAQITTFLDEGKIQLTGAFIMDQDVVLRPGQEAILTKADGHLEVIDRIGYKAGLWKDGKLIFYNNTLAEMVTVLERKFGVRIVIMSHDVESYKFSGDFSDVQLFELLGYLSAARPFNYESKDDLIVITKR